MTRSATLALLLLASCSGKPSARNCAMVEREARPRVAITWKITHGAIDSDPPRARVKLVVAGAATADLDLGELEGVCRLSELGALPDVPANGSKVSELACFHAGFGMYATVFLTEPGKLVVRRFDRNEPTPEDESPPLKNQRELRTIEAPTCATYATELSQGGEL